MANVYVLFLLLFTTAICFVNSERTFGIDYANNTFVKDGKPFRYISGSIHYSRVPWQYWDDRLAKMAAAGLNAIQTYVPWNIHEPVQSRYDFTGQQDIVLFLRTAQKYNLSVILRPGPYICAEWEFGGLPAWLLKFQGMKVRTMNPDYINAVDSYMTKLYTVVKPLLYKNGGPIITVQVENEYGSFYACDYAYLGYLRDKARTILGEDVVLFTTDGDGDGYLKCGTLPDVYSTVDFGITSDPAASFNIQRHKEPHGPLVNSEFYTGWLDNWGVKHSTTNGTKVAQTLDLMLDLGANVNMYMFEGGTNFGFWNGANYAPFAPAPTSYDHDAALTEAGDITQKYMTLRKVIAKYNPLPQMDIPPSTPKYAYGKLQLDFVQTLESYAQGHAGSFSPYPLTMETLDHYYGFMMYQTTLTDIYFDDPLIALGVRDRAYVSIQSKQHSSGPVGIIERGGNMTLNVIALKGDVLTIIVENQGRIVYGNGIDYNTKGLLSNVTLGNDTLTDWWHYPIHIDDMSQLPRKDVSSPWQPAPVTMVPSIYQGSLIITGEVMDTYLDMSQWTKGQLFINGHNVGRYWPKKGPQVRLYVPKYFLQKGYNNVIMLELEIAPCVNDTNCYVQFKDQPLINGTVTKTTPDKTEQTVIGVLRLIMECIMKFNVFTPFWRLFSSLF